MAHSARPTLETLNPTLSSLNPWVEEDPRRALGEGLECADTVLG